LANSLAIYPYQPQQLQFLKKNYQFYAFIAFSSQQIETAKVLVSNLFSFCNTLQLLYHSL